MKYLYNQFTFLKNGDAALNHFCTKKKIHKKDSEVLLAIFIPRFIFKNGS